MATSSGCSAGRAEHHCNVIPGPRRALRCRGSSAPCAARANENIGFQVCDVPDLQPKNGGQPWRHFARADGIARLWDGGIHRHAWLVRRLTGAPAACQIRVIAEGSGNVLRLAVAQDQLGSDSMQKRAAHQVSSLHLVILERARTARIVGGRYSAACAVSGASTVTFALRLSLALVTRSPI